MKRLPAIHYLVRANIDKARAKQEKSYNKGKRVPKFKVGDKVLRRNHTLSDGDNFFMAKIAPKWRGPCLLTDIKGPGTYLVFDFSCLRSVKVVAKDLIPFISNHTNLAEFAFSSSQTGPKEEKALSGETSGGSGRCLTPEGQGDGPRNA